MFLTGIGTALPAHRYTQTECWEALRASPLFDTLPSRARAILRKVLTGSNGIATRHLALDPLHEAFHLTPDNAQRRFTLHAPDLAARAGASALAHAGLRPDQIDAVLVSTCTGYLCPGLTSYVSERLGLRPDTLCLDLVGQGCGAALPNLATAHALLAAGRAAHTLSICVEVCSAAFYLDEDPGVLISACLFGDGAAAAVGSTSPKPGARPVHWTASASTTRTDLRDELRFEHRDGLLRNILKPSVPTLAAESAAGLLDRTLAARDLPRDAIRSWVWHAGGRDVLTAVRSRLGLDDHALRHSHSVLRDCGNLSSPCVLFVLDRALRDSAPDGPWWMSSFGAGFSCHGALLTVG